MPSTVAPDRGTYQETQWQSSINVAGTSSTMGRSQTGEGASFSEFLITTPPQQAQQEFQDAFAQLAALAKLGADWDSYGAEEVSELALKSARNLLVKLLASEPPVVKPPYFVGPLANGGVQLEWREAGICLETEVGPSTGTYSYLLTDNRGFSEEVDDATRDDVAELISRGLDRAHA